jgi:hypothetical protein
MRKKPRGVVEPTLTADTESDDEPRIPLPDLTVHASIERYGPVGAVGRRLMSNFESIPIVIPFIQELHIS